MFAALRRAAACCLLAAGVLAPLLMSDVDAGTPPAKHQDRITATEEALDVCDPRPTHQTSVMCRAPVSGAEPARVVRVVTIGHRAGPALTVLERRPLP